MKKITLNKQKYNCPTSWSDITVQDQIRVSQIAAEHTGLTKNLQLIAGYAKIPVEEIKRTHISKLTNLLKHLDFIVEPMNEDPIYSFEHRGHEYSVMQSLQDAEFQDFISLESVMAMYKDNNFEALPMMIAILCKREGESLDSYDIEERAKEFLDLPIDTANRVSVFFSRIGLISQINTPTFLEAYQKKTNQELTNSLDELESTIQQSGGQGLLGNLRRWTLRKYAQSFRRDFLSS